MINCEHGRDCKNCPNEILHKITLLLREAAFLLESVHSNFDGIAINCITTSYGCTEAILERNL